MFFYPLFAAIISAVLLSFIRRDKDYCSSKVPYLALCLLSIEKKSI